MIFTEHFAQVSISQFVSFFVFFVFLCSVCLFVVLVCFSWLVRQSTYTGISDLADCFFVIVSMYAQRMLQSFF